MKIRKTVKDSVKINSVAVGDRVQYMRSVAEDVLIIHPYTVVTVVTVEEERVRVAFRQKRLVHYGSETHVATHSYGDYNNCMWVKKHSLLRNCRRVIEKE